MISNTHKLTLSLLPVALLSISFLIFFYFLNNYNLTFELHKLIPAISAAAFLKGLTTARKAYKAGKSLRTALKFIGSWSLVSLVISVGGDWLIGMLLSGDLKVLANW